MQIDKNYARKPSTSDLQSTIRPSVICQSVAMIDSWWSQSPNVRSFAHLLFQRHIFFGDCDHVATGQRTGQSVVAVDVLLELGRSADQQPTTSEVEKFSPDQRRSDRFAQPPLRHVTLLTQLVDETLL